MSGEPNFHFSVLMTWPVSVEYVKKRKFWNIEAGRTCKYEARWHCSRRVCLTPINRPRPLKRRPAQNKQLKGQKESSKKLELTWEGRT